MQTFETTQKLAATEEANAILVEAEHEATQKVRFGWAVLIGTLILGSFAAVWATKFVYEETTKAKEIKTESDKKIKAADKLTINLQSEISKKQQEISKINQQASADRQNANNATIGQKESEKVLTETNKNLDMAKAALENVETQAKQRDVKVQEDLNKSQGLFIQKQQELKTLQQKLDLINGQRENLRLELKNLNWTEKAITDLFSKIDTIDEAKKADELSKNSPQVSRGIKVEIFFKKYNDIDKNVVTSALSLIGFQYTVQDSDSEIPINTILYGKNVSSDDVKNVAYIMIRAGIRIRAIKPFATQAEKRPLEIQVGSFLEFENDETWTVKRVQDTDFSPTR